MMLRVRFSLRWAIRIGFAAATAIVVTAGGAANAAAVGPYQNQALGAGLSLAQAEELQGKVQKYVTEFGGRQVSANEVSIPGGKITVALPDEKSARSLSGSLPCWGGSFCVYQYMYLGGDVVSEWRCAYYIHVPASWGNNTGSWWNNQVYPATALLYDWSWQLNYISYTPYYGGEIQDMWYLGTLGHVDPC